ncbi:MAG: triacylglycerol lipase, partial [Lachnospiraceae bacterium]|nr:triacylglycerol lipase [Lachnospiraceae bacterium]
HHGSLTVDRLLQLPEILVRLAAGCWDVWLRVCGDKNPNAYEVFHTFTTREAEAFNRRNPDAPGVYYQSYAFVMKHVWSDMFLCVPSAVVSFFEGPNDGLLAPRAVAWTNFCGVVTSSSGRGISHCDEVDMRRRRLTRRQGDGICDITDFYVNVVQKLREMGF